MLASGLWMPTALPQTSNALLDKIKARCSASPGTVGLAAKNLHTGAEVVYRADEKVRTASTIKLPIMVESFAAVAEGRAKWTDEVTLTADDKVYGSGVLREFSDNIKLPFRDLVNLMIVVSDNTATNLVLDKLSADAVNERMQKLGLAETRSLRKIRGDGAQLKSGVSGVSQAGAVEANKKYGIGVSTPREMVRLLEMLHQGKAVNVAASAEMIAILKRQQHHEGIGRTLRDVTIASKSGSLDHLRADTGIIYHPKGAIAMAIWVDDLPELNWTSDNPGALLLSDLSLLVIEGLGNSPSKA